MRFVSGVLAALVVTANSFVLPKREESMEWNETCIGIETKTRDTWKKTEIGEWFISMANAEDIYTKDIQKTIQSWDHPSSLYGFYCSPMSYCEANLDKDQCLDPRSGARPGLYFLMWSIANLNNYMLSVLNAVEHTSSVAIGLSANLVETFATNMDNIPLVNAGPSMAAGFLGGLAAIFPPSAALGGLGSAAATIGGGIISLLDNEKPVELEPKFNDFKNITNYIARASEGMQMGIEKYTRWLLTSIPSNDRSHGVWYIDDPNSLPNVLRDGAFAEPITSDVLPDSIYVSLFSAAIALLWRGEPAGVVKITHEYSKLSKPICENKDAWKGNKYCDDQGNAYLLIRLDSSWNTTPWDDGIEDKFKKLKGVEKLGDYRISIKTVVKASEHAASKNGGRPYYEWNPSNFIDHINEDPRNRVEFSGFNLPFCELGLFRGGGDPGLLDRDECDTECQTIWAMRNCFVGLDREHPNRGGIPFERECDYRECKFCMGGFAGC
ncbi:uncharacterized protein PGRI_034470 [Penicillium griseofulvum]|uniref:Uncharacterized protein n=1 Tax=Penicillium patulum TaxID=5078 RepID=A0A135L9X3_PENPA|nr:uncharacterized protein PGRI_034470 [Penicillium griseofulvum]KXG45680.1 hypothetical protein PGRI_034470 [Penicillium griseofulvum]